MFAALLKKELHDLVRQPRSLIAAILYPLLVLPLLAAILAPQESENSCLAIDASVPSDLSALVRNATQLPSCTRDDESRLDLMIEDGRARIEASDWKGTDASLEAAKIAISQAMVERAAQRQGASPIAANNLAKAAVPLPADESSDAIGVFGLIPIVAMFMAALGCAYPALESGVGEKETGTLLGLFQAPISDRIVVAAKFSATWLCACVAVFAGLVAAMGIMFWQLDSETTGRLLNQSATGLAFLYAALAAMPLAAASILVSLASQSLREAQQYLMILVCIAVLAGGAALIALDAPWMAQIPIANAAGGIASELTGQMNASYQPSWIVVANLALTLALLAAGTAQLRRLRQSL
ncbi:ABC transporter permease subunit [Alteriqipengyuania sp. 357]